MDKTSPPGEQYHLIHLRNNGIPRVFGVVFIWEAQADSPQHAIGIARETLDRMQGVDTERLSFSYLGIAPLNFPADTANIGHLVEYAPGDSPKRPTIIVII